MEARLLGPSHQAVAPLKIHLFFFDVDVNMDSRFHIESTRMRCPPPPPLRILAKMRTASDDPARKTSLSSGGFSLVEVTISLGLVAFIAVSVIGLLPTGLSAMRNAVSQTVEAQIVRSIAGQSVVANFTNLTAGSPFYFDHEGQSMASADNATYTVTVSQHAPVFPGSERAAAGLSESLVNLRIEIVGRPTPQAVGTTTVRTLQVANYGK